MSQTRPESWSLPPLPSDFRATKACGATKWGDFIFLRWWQFGVHKSISNALKWKWSRIWGFQRLMVLKVQRVLFPPKILRIQRSFVRSFDFPIFRSSLACKQGSGYEWNCIEHDTIGNWFGYDRSCNKRDADLKKFMTHVGWSGLWSSKKRLFINLLLILHSNTSLLRSKE